MNFSKLLRFNLTSDLKYSIIKCCEFEPLAQLVEHLTFNQVVTGSIPVRLIRFISNRTNVELKCTAHIFSAPVV